LFGRPQVDAQRQDALVDAGLGVAEHGEVLDVELRLFDEVTAHLALDGRHRTLLHRRCALLEPLHHLIGIERCDIVDLLVDDIDRTLDDLDPALVDDHVLDVGLILDVDHIVIESNRIDSVDSLR